MKCGNQIQIRPGHLRTFQNQMVKIVIHIQLHLQPIKQPTRFTFLKNRLNQKLINISFHFAELMPCHPTDWMELINRPGNSVCVDCISTTVISAEIDSEIVLCCLCVAINRLNPFDPSFLLIWSSISWDPNNMLALHQVGNAVANSYWEFALWSNIKRSTQSNPQVISRIEEFIRNKDVNQKWINPVEKCPVRYQALLSCCSRLDHDFENLSLEFPWLREPMDMGSARCPGWADFE
jgi:hypothetical protein